MSRANYDAGMKWGDIYGAVVAIAQVVVLLVALVAFVLLGFDSGGGEANCSPWFNC